MGGLRALVTGSEGFIGSHLCQLLETEGYKVSRLDRVAKTPETLYGAGAAIKSIKPDVVFHLAAEAGVTTPRVRSFGSNIDGTAVVTEACLEVGCRLVFTSSGAVLSATNSDASCYGISKLTGELFIKLMGWKGLKYGICRLSNVYGFQTKPKAVVGSFMKALLCKHVPIINGDGTQVRDFVYVKDVIQGLLCVSKSPFNHTWNLSTGVGTSVKDLWDMMAEAAEPIEAYLPQLYPDGFVGAKRSVMEPSSEPWWTPRPLSEGLKETIGEFRERSRV